jgi:serine phosphatase RsbU (regulator of sigma subunit)
MKLRIDPNGRAMDIILNHLSKLSTFAILVRSYASVIIIAIIDYLTGPNLSMLVFYLIPIIVTSWYVGRRAGFLIATVSAIACSIHDTIFFLDYAKYTLSSWLILIWNPLIAFSVFVIVTWILSGMRRAEDEKLRLEFKVAAEVQSRLFPQSLPSMKTISFVALCKPTTIVSGDYYDFLLIQPHILGIAIGDIAGKGLSAALLMANLQGLLRSHAPLYGENVADLMSNINRTLFESTDSTKFATLFYGLYNDIDRTLTYVNAGHNPPIVFRKKNHQDIKHTDNTFNHGMKDDKSELYDLIRLETGGTVIGAFSDITFSTNTLYLDVGDTILFYTDGLSEARNFIHEQYGEERLSAFVSSKLHEPPRKLHDSIFSDVQEFIGDGIQFDDMTLVVAKIN